MRTHPDTRPTPGAAWKQWMSRRSAGIEEAIEAILPDPGVKPAIIHRAMRYSVFSGGKRIRPGLTILGFEVAGGKRPGRDAAKLGAAIELLHTFSLIHDDLPCMDDDDFRRGRPTCHQKFGEAMAVLAGDGLQVVAFEALAGLRADPETRVRIIHGITQAVGTAGVIGGQVVDIESEGRKIAAKSLRWIHAHKTGALLRCALVSGAELAGTDRSTLRRLIRFGDTFGIFFQVVDDILNEVGSRRVLGRDRGGDRKKGKATYPSILGMDRTRQQLKISFDQCRETIPVQGKLAPVFLGLLHAVVERLPGGWSNPILKKDADT